MIATQTATSARCVRHRSPRPQAAAARTGVATSSPPRPMKTCCVAYSVGRWMPKSPPACAGQTDCGLCVEVTCNATGIYSFNGDGFTHDEFCKAGQSVVVQLIDACPHNHPSNTYWCTTARPQHIDLSCTAFNALVNAGTARPLSTIGSINVYTRPVDCSVGLGVHTF